MPDARQPLTAIERTRYNRPPTGTPPKPIQGLESAVIVSRGVAQAQYSIKFIEVTETGIVQLSTTMSHAFEINGKNDVAIDTIVRVWTTIGVDGTQYYAFIAPFTIPEGVLENMHYILKSYGGVIQPTWDFGIIF